MEDDDQEHKKEATEAQTSQNPLYMSDLKEYSSSSDLDKTSHSHREELPLDEHSVSNGSYTGMEDYTAQEVAAQQRKSAN